MARYTGPANKLYRNKRVTDLGAKTVVSTITQYPSGQHGQGRKKTSEYGLHLKEKQKIRFTYLVSEKQMRRCYNEASRKKGVTGTILLQLLELRLDNILYRAGMTVTRRQSRQLVGHGHVLVNGRKVDIPSFRAKIGDEITIRAKSSELFKNITEDVSQAHAPEWLQVDPKALKIRVERVPEREEMDTEFKEQLIIEYYSR